MAQRKQKLKKEPKRRPRSEAVKGKRTAPEKQALKKLAEDYQRARKRLIKD